MDTFAFISLGIAAVIVAVILGCILWDLIREPIGQAFLLGLFLIAVAGCAVIGAVWLIGTRLI